MNERQRPSPGIPLTPALSPRGRGRLGRRLLLTFSPPACGRGRGRVGRVEGAREMVVRSNYIVVYADDVVTVTVLQVLHAAQQWPRT